MPVVPRPSFALAFPRSLSLGLLVTIALAHVSASARQEPSIDLDVPLAPVVVSVDGAPHLVYELHVTNFQRQPVTLQRLQVLADQTPAAVADVQGPALARMIGRPGLARDEGDALVVNPGQRSIVYLWTRLGSPSMRPTAIRHVVDLSLGGRSSSVRSRDIRISTDTVPIIDPPLAGGPWVAIYDPLLVGGHRTTVLAIDGRARIPGRFAIDWVRAPAGAGVATPVDPERGYVADGFGADVLAVASGLVVDARDGHADLPAGVRAPASRIPLADASGNHIVLDIGDGRFAVYEHLQRDSVAVKTGDRVQRGQIIARLGSSGSTSIGPHLHFHVADGGAPLTAEGRPFAIRRLERLGAYESLTALVGGAAWVADAAGPRSIEGEHPAPLSVVRF